MDQAIGIDTLRRRRHFRLATGLLLCAGFLAAAWGINRAVRPGVAAGDIRVAEVRRGTSPTPSTPPASSFPSTRKWCPARSQSRVAKVHAKPGQQVKQGELLLELDDREIRLALDGAEGAAGAAGKPHPRAGWRWNRSASSSVSSIELLELDLQSSRALRERNQQAAQSGLVSGEDLLSAELNVKRTEIQLRQQRELIVDTRRATASSIAAANLQKEILQKQIAQQQVACWSRPACARPSPAC
jgi:HlyD family secretion protein